MKLKTSFEKFLELIKLNKTRKEALISAHNTIRDYLKSDDEIKSKFIESFLQGSYAMHTEIKPKDGSPFDVDVALVLNLKDENGNLMNGYSVTNWVADRLRISAIYKDKIEEVKPKCVRMKYSGELRLDIVPLHLKEIDKSDILLIPPEYNETNPKGLKIWAKEKNDKAKDNFYDIVKMLKWWKRIQFSDSQIKSLPFTVLIGTYITIKELSKDESLVLTMEAIDKYLSGLSVVPEIKNPSLPDENLSRDWSYFDFITFKDKFHKATLKAREAFDEEDEEKTIALWNDKVLFNDTFPKTKYEKEIKEAQEMNDLMKSGSLGIISTGTITNKQEEKSTPIKPTRFYGKESTEKEI